MPKTKIEFVCRECGASHHQWVGQCLECKAWNTLEEIVVSQVTSSKPESLKDLPASKVKNLSEITTENNKRLTTGLSELDRTLGGGLVDGSVVLIGGDPGIGKSTLILQALAAINQSDTTLYVSGEESAEQVSERAIRLGIKEDILFISETHLENIFIDQNQQGNGIAKAILETIMSTNPNIVDGKEKLNIINITPSALDFWQNLGTGFIADKYGDIELTSGRLGFSDVVYSKPTAELESDIEETMRQAQAK